MFHRSQSATRASSGMWWALGSGNRVPAIFDRRRDGCSVLLFCEGEVTSHAIGTATVTIPVQRPFRVAGIPLRRVPEPDGDALAEHFGGSLGGVHCTGPGSADDEARVRGFWSDRPRTHSCIEPPPEGECRERSEFFGNSGRYWSSEHMLATVEYLTDHRRNAKSTAASNQLLPIRGAGSDGLVNIA